MGEAEVKVQISLGSIILREWKEVHNSNLPGILNSIKRLKESVNDFLTDVLTKTKNSRGNEFLEEIKKLDSVEDEDLEEDPFTEILKEIVNVGGKNPDGKDLKKSCCISQPKRLKK